MAPEPLESPAESSSSSNNNNNHNNININSAPGSALSPVGQQLAHMGGLQIDSHAAGPLSTLPDSVAASSSSSSSKIEIPDVPRAYAQRRDWIVSERKGAVQAYMVRSKKEQGVPAATPQTDGWLRRTERLLNFLQHELDMSPRYRDEAHIDTLLAWMYRKPEFCFPEALRLRAQALFEEFEAGAWGAAAAEADADADADVTGEESEGEVEKLAEEAVLLQSPTVATATPTPGAGVIEPASTAIVHILQAPASHPIWGLEGIMHGISPKIGGKVKKVLLLDRRFLHEKRSASAMGHNGLEVGQWFPYQLSALFYGAHGKRIAGIYGDAQHGAYSIVVAGAYKEVDEDHGDEIIYSGPGSSTNQDPHNLPDAEGSTKLLQLSVQTGSPVRVLRSATKHASSSAGALAPEVGIRYDGLYSVASQLPSRRNPRGGLYCSFRLVRLPKQESLAAIVARSPTRRQRADFARIWDLW